MRHICMGFLVTVSNSMKEKYSAHDLIELFFEFRKLVPKGINWSESKLKNNLAHYYRFKQLESLCVAFDIKSVFDLSDGYFIEDTQIYYDFHHRMVFVCILDDINPKIQGLNRVDVLTDGCMQIQQSVLYARGESIKAIAKIVSEDNRVYDKSTLVYKFEFPDVDIKELDIKCAIF